MSMSKKTSSKKIVNLVGILLVVGFIILVACNMSHSKVFKLEKGEAEALGVVFPEEGSSYESYNSLFDKFKKDKEYEKAIAVIKKMIEVFPEGKEGYYIDLLNCYERLKRYEEALIVNQKLIKIMPPNPNDEFVTCGYIVNYAAILEHSGKQTEAIKFLEKYRKECPKITEGFIPALKEAQSKGQLFFPVPH